MTETLVEPPSIAAEPVPRPHAPRLTHVRSLDGLRGVAVLAVVFYHFAPDVMPGGFLGVDLFFVLSGFLITSLLVNEWGGTARISLSSFWTRRARRLVPALFLVLVAVGIYALLVPDQVDGQRFSVDGLSALGYVANWRFISSGQSYIDQFLSHTPSPLRHTWSLAIEEQFYLVWPVVVVLVGLVVKRLTGDPGRRARRLRRTLLTMCLVLGAASLLRMHALHDAGEDLNRVYYGTDSRAFVILFGAALGALTAGVPTVARAFRRFVVVVGCCLAVALAVAVAFISAESSWLYEGGYGIVALAMVAVLLAAAQPGSNPLARVLESRALVGLGLISYGVYLWHWPISLWVTEGGTGLDDVSLFVVRAGHHAGGRARQLLHRGAADPNGKAPPDPRSIRDRGRRRRSSLGHDVARRSCARVLDDPACTEDRCSAVPGRRRQRGLRSRAALRQRRSEHGPRSCRGAESRSSSRATRSRERSAAAFAGSWARAV